MNRLVIQLARMGDVVQSLPLLELLREQYPRDRLTLLVDAPLAPLFERLSGIDNVSGLATENAWDAALNENWARQYEWWRDVLQPLLHVRYDQVIALNHSKVAAALAGIVPASERLGYQLSENRREIVRPTPLNLLFACVKHRPFARWHLADLYAALADYPYQVPSEPGKLIHWSTSVDRSSADGVKKIGMIIGAGDPKRLLTPEFFAKLIAQVLTGNHDLVMLIGNGHDGERQRKILSLLTEKERLRTIPTAGDIPLGQLPDRLMDCDLVVGSDTGPLHIAAWCHVPTLGLYFSSASVYQTGPYGRNCWVIDSVVPCRMCKEEDSCQTVQCRDQLSAPVVAETIGWILRGGADKRSYPDQPPGCQENLRLRKAQFDEFGITYSDVVRDGIDPEACWQRPILGQVLFPECGNQSTNKQLPPAVQRKILAVCRDNHVPEQEPSLAILKDFLEFEELHGRPETRREIQKLLGKSGTVDVNVPRWSVIIPVHNQRHLTRQCLQSISETTDFRDMEILVIDNGSTDDTARVIENWAGPIRRIEMRSNSGFSTACNRGASLARGQWLLFLNNDTVVQCGWYEALNDAVTQFGIGTIVGCRLLYPDGRIQHAGVRFDDHGLPVHVGKGCLSDDPKWKIPRSHPAVTAAAMAVSKSGFDGLGGFDEGYVNGYEDVDFCLRAIQQGVRIMYVPDIEIIHHQGMTPGRYWNDSQNEKRFLDKWEQTIRSHPEWHIESTVEVPGKHKSAKKTASSKESSTVRKRFLVITGEPVNYPSPTLRLISPLSAFKEKGWLDYSVLPLSDDRATFRRDLDKSSGMSGIIVQRTLPQNWMDEEVLQYVDRSGIPLILDTDDLIVGGRNRGRQRPHEDTGRDNRFLAMVRRAALVSVTTVTLRQLFGDWLLRVAPDEVSRLLSKITILPNLIDPKIWNTGPLFRDNSNGKVRMAFFGSETHGLDLAMIAPAIRQVLVAHSNKVELCCWGCITEELKTVDGVRYMGPYDPDYAHHARRLSEAGVDIAVVPLLPNRFNRAKSPIKYLEFGICGIPGIYSNLEPYHHVVHHQDNGILASDDTGSWVGAMTRLIDDREYRLTLASRARQDVIENHLLPDHIDRWKAVLRAVTRPRVKEQLLGGELADEGVCQHFLSKEGH